MIEASFDRMSRAAAISGAYQYDTGQRLRLSGLPSPDEFAQMDDLVSGSSVAVQVHYSHTGDSQSEMRLAQWDDWRGVWIAEIPDEYLTRSEPVNVHVYVYYGEKSEDLMFLNTEAEVNARAQTMYEGVFTPKSRPAPGGSVTNEQLEAWAEYVENVDLALADAGSAVTLARGAATAALAAAEEAEKTAKTTNAAAKNAEDAAAKLEAATSKIGRARVSVIDLDPELAQDATVVLYHNTVTFGIVQGAKGEQGDAGKTGPTDITLAFSSGALTITPKEG